MKKLILSLFFGILYSVLSLNAQQVSPYQTGHYSTCFTNVRDMAKMAPGLAIISYNYFASANKYADQNGNKFSDFQLPAINSSLDVDMGTFATVPAFFWGSINEVFGGATFVVGIVPNYIWADVNARFSHSADAIIDSSFTIQESAKLAGFGDLFVSPFGLSYGWKHADLNVNYGFTAPTGRFDVEADDNIGLGFWTHQFQSIGYYYPKEDQSTALMLGLTYELNTKIKGEDFNPGNRMSLEYGVSQYFTERLELGIMGGNNWQLTDDKGEDVGLNATIHDRISTLSFSAAYWAVQGRLYVSAKYMFDYAARQRFMTQGGIVSLIFVTNAMDGVKKEKNKVN